MGEEQASAADWKYLSEEWERQFNSADARAREWEARHDVVEATLTARAEAAERERDELRAFRQAVYSLAGPRPPAGPGDEPEWRVDLFEVERRARAALAGLTETGEKEEHDGEA